MSHNKGQLYRQVVVSFDWIGFHYWADAPPGYDYLKQTHRHKFKACVTLSVDHGNREVEFHELQGVCKEILSHGTFGITAPVQMSCEDFALQIMEGVQDTYGKDRIAKVEVSEDGECAGVVTWIP